MSPSRFLFFPQGILASVLNDDLRKRSHNEGNVKRHPKRKRKIYRIGGIELVRSRKAKKKSGRRRGMTKEVKTGMMAFIILVVVMAVFLFVRPKDWFDGNYFRMTASFSSVQGIKKGNEVRYAGVRVGEVSKISTEGNEGILEMRIKKDAQIPLDAEFTVSQSGVIGDYYVDIRGGHFDGSYFGEGMRVEEKRSNRLDQMMERAKKLMDSAAQMKENIGKMEGK